MSESPVDNTEPFLSFANPNYQFEDRLNSNIGNLLSGTTSSSGPGSNLVSLEHTISGSLKDHLISTHPGDITDCNNTTTTTLNSTIGTPPSSYINEEDLDLDIHHLSFSSSAQFNLDEEKENIGLCADDRRNYDKSIHLDRVDPLQQHYNTLPLAIKQRKRYAQLDLSSMGIDLSPSDGHNPLAAGHELGLLMSPCDGTEDAVSDDDDTSGTYEQLEKDPLLVYKDDDEDEEEDEEEDDDDDDDDDEDEEDEEGMGVYELDEEDDDEVGYPDQDDYDDDDEEDEEEDNRLNEDERRRKNIKENLSMCMQQVEIVGMTTAGSIGCNRDLNSLSDEKPRSFLEYYSLLEAKARERQERDDINEADQLDSTDVNIIHKTDVCDSQDEDDDAEEVEEIEDDEDEEYENTKVISFEKSNNLKNEQYINSPDSHDSGIQSDTRLDENILNIPSEITRIPSGEKDCYEKFNDEKLGLDDCNDIDDDDGVHAVDDDVDEVDNIKDIEDDDEEEEDDYDDDDDDQDSVEENNSETLTDSKMDSEENTPVEQLPQGWERHEDEDGPYYWHIQSGTIQRSPPPPPSPGQLETKRSNSNSSDSSQASAPSSVPSSPNSTSSNTEEHLQAFESHVLKYAAKSLQSLCSSTEKSPVPVRKFSKHEPVRFAVRSFGWVCIADDDLSPAKSSKAVNKCILDLSLGRNDLNGVVGRWGDGKDLYMDLDDHSLRLVSPVDETILNIQPIHTIRVWGVGRDNGRDFAYVSRDKTTRKHMCHVFRCDSPAREIANTLRDICKRIMLEQGLQRNANMNRLNRPTDLPNLEGGGNGTGQPNGQKLTFQNLYNNTSFPTPMEEPKKVIRCHYLGFKEVFKASGMDTLNNAIESLYTKVPPEMWVFVNVAIAPSTITISEHSNPDKKIDECRVRFLSFMGIAMSNIKLCAFIMHTAEDQYFAHVFHCEPSAGPLCKTIEAACKLRYQKCLDAHPQTPTSQNSQNKSLGASIRKGVKSIVNSISHKYRPPK